ncbi:hypothetical protein MTP04_18900 [Lysinibacillus sp. PLM2]|nr:hypothetical protein MTP04_18900 [Lysinibacillus sp. PLM2]
MSIITISPGHYAPGSGAKDIIDEVIEARKVVSRIVQLLKNANIGVTHIEDNTSDSLIENLDYLVTEHNKSTRKLDVSIHFNSTSGRHDTNIGTEVLYVSDKMKPFATQVSKAISNASGLRNRGGKKRTNLAFLNNTNKPSILIELCFVNSTVDVLLYRKYFDEICIAITNELIQYVQPGHASIQGIAAQQFKQESNSTDLITALKGTLPLENFTGPTLVARLQEILTNKEIIKQVLEMGIEDKIIQPIWLEKLNNSSLTTSDFLGISTLIAENKTR